MTTHIVQKQVFELQAKSMGTSVEWEASAAAFQQEVVIKTIEACFNNVSLDGRHLIIDKLEIDLGIFTTADFFKEAPQRLTEQLEKALYLVKQDSLSAENKLKNNGNYNADFLLQSAEWKTSTVLAGSSETKYSAFASFLLSGRFPWWYANQEQQKALQNQFSRQWMSALPDAAKIALKEMLVSSEKARIRIANHFDAEWINDFLLTLETGEAAGLKRWKFMVTLSKDLQHLHAVLKQHYWADISLYTGASALEPYAPVSNFLKIILERSGSLEHTLRERFQDACLDKIHSLEYADLSRFILRTLNTVKPGGQKQRGSESKGVQNNLSASDEAQAKKGQVDKLDATAKDLSEIKSGDETAMFIQHAGLVLLHPFLSELFSSAGLWMENTWRSEEAKFTALKMLAYLSCGETDVPEYRLVFHKILTGMKEDSIVVSSPELTTLEKETCNELLLAVISHWTALRNTSPDGLREAFLQRDGKLSETSGHHALVVERKTEDILLSHLPWGYAMIRLPWMDKMLQVSWT